MINFCTGQSLVVLQNQYLNLYATNNTITESQIRDLEQNLWIQAATKLAPSNICIRQFCIIDLFRNSPIHLNAIKNQLHILTYKNDNEYRIWAEGYSYYEYTRQILCIWLDKFPCDSISATLLAIDKGFKATAYERNGLIYPAPYGDVRDIPLRDDLQSQIYPANTIVDTITMLPENNQIHYMFRGKPIGLNTHIPLNDYAVTMQNGIPINFKFYSGYQNKYKNSFDEYKDTYNPKRIKSIVS